MNNYTQTAVLTVALAISLPARATCAADVGVSSHVLEVSVATNGRTTVTETWEVDIGDPTACPDGVPAPPGMDGATWGELSITAGLTPPPTRDEVQTWTKTRTVRSGSTSGLFASSPVGTAKHTSATLSVPSWTELNVWADPEATRTPDLGRSHTYSVSWPANSDHELAWSTMASWWEASDALSAHTKRVVATSRYLGDWGRDLGGKSIDELITETADKIAWDPSGSQHWLAANKATAALKDGRGGPADRAAVLLSALRAAGYDAQPGWSRARPTRAPDTFPVPAAMTRPLIRVQTSDTARWIDPMLPADTPLIPPDLVGDLVQQVGDYPTVLGDFRAPSGHAALELDVTYNLLGDTTIRGKLTATGEAAAALRAHSEARPGWVPESLALGAMSEPEMHDGALTYEFEAKGRAGASSAFGGTQVDLEALIAPQLAIWLPSGTEIHEQARWTADEPVLVISASPPKGVADEAQVVTAHVSRDTDTVTLWSTLVVTSSGSVNLPENPPVSRLLVFGDPSKKTLKAIKKGGATPANRAAIEARAMLELGDTKKLASTLVKATKKATVEELAHALARHHQPGEIAAWSALYQAASLSSDKLFVVEALASVGERREAWRLAGPLAGSTNLDVQVRALVAVAQLQDAQRPNQETDEEAWRAWRDPLRILRTAANRDPGDGSGHPSVRAPLVDELVRTGEPFDANQYAAAAMRDSPDDGYTRAVVALHGAATGAALAPVQEHLAAAHASAPGDPMIAALAARTWAHLGHPGRAADLAIRAARLAGDDATLWHSASERALVMGDLPAALWASGLASEANPTDTTINVKFQLLATFMGDEDLATLAADRSGYRAFHGSLPAPLPELMRVASDDQQLALLIHRDAEVITDPDLLSQRMTLAIEAGLDTVAARDGAQLAKLHRRRFGEVGLGQAVAGDWWSNKPLPSLTRALREPSARRARMESSLITGTGDALSDARQLRSDPLAQLLIRAASKPETVAKSAPVWALEREDPQGTFPEGCSQNKVLGGPTGLVACTDVAHRSTTLWTTQSTSGRLPPPLGITLTLETAEPGLLPTFAVGGTLLPVYFAIRVTDQGEAIGLALNPTDAVEAAHRELTSAE